LQQKFDYRCVSGLVGAGPKKVLVLAFAQYPGLFLLSLGKAKGFGDVVVNITIPLQKRKKGSN